MSGNVKERYTPFPMAADSTLLVTSDSIGGFLALTSGTITVIRKNDDGSNTTIVNGVSVTAGIYTPLPFYLGKNNGSVILGGGASGTLAV